MRFHSVALCLRDMIQPTWAHTNPSCRTEWTSPGWSESAVLRRPPEGALLRRQRAEQRQQELDRPRRPVRAVREVAVIAGGDAEHAHVIEDRREEETLPREADEDDADDRRDVHGEERD